MHGVSVPCANYEVKNAVRSSRSMATTLTMEVCVLVLPYRSTMATTLTMEVYVLVLPYRSTGWFLSTKKSFLHVKVSIPIVFGGVFSNKNVTVQVLLIQYKGYTWEKKAPAC